jgi:MFS family permease/cytidylate kinase
MADANYKWVALSNTTLGMLVATINSSIVLISLPAIFNGIHLDPLTPVNAGYLLWLLMGYTVVTAVLVVSFGRVGDMYGRVRMYNLGFGLFTLASVGLSVVFGSGPWAALELIGLRVIQGVGGALLMANSVAILTDAFPENERGLALGINGVAALAGSFIGLILGGILSVVNWHLVFLVSVPFGLFGTIWAYVKLREIGQRNPSRIDWIGNSTFALGLIAVLTGITGAIQPQGTSAMSWTSAQTIGELLGGVLLLVAFIFIEGHVPEPMFRLQLFRNRRFAAGNVAGLLASIGRGGLMFVLIIWLQGVWLPLHGVAFEATPIWAAIDMLPMTFGFLVAGPISGYLSDRYGARAFATAGMLGAAISFGLFLLLPADFAYVWFALILLLNGLSMGLFSAPNAAAIMNAVPAAQRGAASGMRASLQNVGMTLSIGLFFSLIIVGLAGSLPRALYSGLLRHGVPAAAAHRIADLPPVGSLFAAFLGYNPMQGMIGGLSLTHAQTAQLTGHSFFPHLIAQPFLHGMHLTFIFAAIIMLVAAAASYLRGASVPIAERSAQEPSARIVTIASSLAAGGSQIGAMVAERLHLRYVERALPLRIAQRIEPPSEHALAIGDTREEAVRRLLDSMASLQTLYGISGPSAADSAQKFREQTEAAMRESARDGAVIMGRGAALVFRDWPNAVHVRIDGSPERRAERLMEIEKIDRQTARERVRRVDAVQAFYVKYFYDADVRDPQLYHVILDGTVLDAQTCTEIVARAVHSAGVTRATVQR